MLNANIFIMLLSKRGILLNTLGVMAMSINMYYCKFIVGALEVMLVLAITRLVDIIEQLFLVRLESSWGSMRTMK